MPRPGANPLLWVERFFQLALLSLVTCGYLAVAGSGYLDKPTVILTACGLLLRALLVTGVLRFEIPDRWVTILTLAYIAFYPVDYFFLAGGFLNATVHLVFFLAVMKILTARTNRDYLYTASIALLEILAAAILSANLNFLLFLAFYLLSAIAAFTSAEIRRAMQKPHRIARGGQRRFHGRLAALSVCVTAGILVLTAGLFFLLPRTANAALSGLVSHRYHLPGFSNEVNLGQIGLVKGDSSAIMHVRPDSKDFPPNLKWRGIALSEFDGKRWFNPPGARPDAAVEREWIFLVGNGQRLRRDGRHISYRVDLNAVDSDALFIAGWPEAIYLGGRKLLRAPHESFRLDMIPFETFRYSVSAFVEGPLDPNAVELLPAQSAPYLRLPPIDPRIPDLARQITGTLLSPYDRTYALEQYLHTQYGYTLELPASETADPLANFLFERKKGHCEYFASALAVMLRTQGIAARMVNGFQSGTLNPVSEAYVVRASDAHSWVEAYLPGRGWTTFDPTPPDLRPRQASAAAMLGFYFDAAETLWQDWVLSYDLGRQLYLADRMQNSSRHFRIRWMDGWSDAALLAKTRATDWLKHYGVVLAALVALTLAAVWLGPKGWRALHFLHRIRRARLGQASVDDATLLYQRMLEVLHRRGYEKPAWFTPGEFAATLPREPGTLVCEFTAAYNALRFGGKLDAAPIMGMLLEDLENGVSTPR